jgi:hypothetical protein
MKAIGFAILIVFVGGCAGSRTVTYDIQDPDRMVEAVLRLAPVGTPIDEAQSMMEREGFKCSRITNGEFNETIRGERRADRRDLRGEEQRKGLDYVSCCRFERRLIGYSTWEVALVHRDDKVVDVLPQIRHYGP